jgi:lysophospholipase L1-like esterase
MNVYESEVINEGRPATKTTDAILVFDDVIELHNAKYLLFHYGTNDAIRLQIPVSLTLFNITEMMTRAKKYSMLPVLSTLVPRDPAHRFGVGVFKNRAVRISDGIKDIGLALNIPVIDFYTIFSEMPDEKGGYYMLMSDRVHPSQAGYSMMSWEWYYVLIAIAPAVPGNFVLTPLSPYTVEVTWQENCEPNFYYYQIEYGVDPLDLNNQIDSWSNTHLFNSEPFIPQLEPRIYFRIRSVNNLGVMSAFSPVTEIVFGE